MNPQEDNLSSIQPTDTTNTKVVPLRDIATSEQPGDEITTDFPTWKGEDEQRNNDIALEGEHDEEEKHAKADKLTREELVQNNGRKAPDGTIMI